MDEPRGISDRFNMLLVWNLLINIWNFILIYVQYNLNENTIQDIDINVKNVSFDNKDCICSIWRLIVYIRVSSLVRMVNGPKGQ